MNRSVIAPAVIATHGGKRVVALADSAEYDRALAAAFGDGEAVLVTVKRQTRPRTYDQLRYWFGVAMRILSEHTGYTKMQMHYLCLAVCFGVVLDEATGREVPVVPASRHLNTAQFSELIEWVGPWAYESYDELYIPLPNKIDLSTLPGVEDQPRDVLPKIKPCTPEHSSALNDVHPPRCAHTGTTMTTRRPKKKSPRKARGPKPKAQSPKAASRRVPVPVELEQGPELTARQAQFVAEYLIDLNATQAAIRAGYSAKTAQEQSSRLLSNVIVADAVAKGRTVRLDKAELTAVRTLEEMRRLAFTNVRDLFDDKGNLRPIHTLTDEQAAAIAGFEVIKKNAEAGDGHTDIVHKVKILDKTRTLEMLGKYFSLLKDQVIHSGGMTIVHELPPDDE